MDKLPKIDYSNIRCHSTSHINASQNRPITIGSGEAACLYRLFSRVVWLQTKPPLRVKGFPHCMHPWKQGILYMKRFRHKKF